MTAKGKGVGLLEVNTLLFLFVDLFESLSFEDEVNYAYEICSIPSIARA